MPPANVRAVNAAVAAEAHALGLLINVADLPAEGNFHMPAVYEDAQCIIAVSSKTASHAFRWRSATGLANEWPRLVTGLSSAQVRTKSF